MDQKISTDGLENSKFRMPAPEQFIWQALQPYFGVVFGDGNVLRYHDVIENRTYDLKKDCVAPLMFTTKPDPVRHNPLPVPVPIVYEKSNSKQRYRVKMGLNGAHLEEVDLLPGGMFLLSRRAIEKARKPLFKYKYDRNGYLIGGTDCVMSERLKEAGFKIYVHRGIVVEQWIDIGAKALNDTMLRYCPMNIEKRIEEISSKSGVIKDG